MKTLLIAFCTLGFSQSVPSKGSSELDAAKRFALGPVGVAAMTSQEELQFKTILALNVDDAKQTLELLYRSGNPQAMSYALAGMRRLDRTRFAKLLVSARASH